MRPSRFRPRALFALVFALATATLASGCGDFFYSRPVQGEIVSLGSRWSANGQGGGAEKIAVQLKPYVADATVERYAGGAAGLAIECLSTRCASLREGQCASFECRHSVRWFEPDVIASKMSQTIDCRPLATLKRRAGLPPVTRQTSIDSERAGGEPGARGVAARAALPPRPGGWMAGEFLSPDL